MTKAFTSAVGKLAVAIKAAEKTIGTARAPIAKAITRLVDAPALAAHKAEFVAAWLAAHDGADIAASFATEGAKGFALAWKDPALNRAGYHWDAILKLAESMGWQRPKNAGRGRNAAPPEKKAEAEKAKAEKIAAGKAAYNAAGKADTEAGTKAETKAAAPAVSAASQTVAMLSDDQQRAIAALADLMLRDATSPVARCAVALTVATPAKVAAALKALTA